MIQQTQPVRMTLTAFEAQELMGLMNDALIAEHGQGEGRDAARIACLEAMMGQIRHGLRATRAETSAVRGG